MRRSRRTAPIGGSVDSAMRVWLRADSGSVYTLKVFSSLGAAGRCVAGAVDARERSYRAAGGPVPKSLGGGLTD